MTCWDADRRVEVERLAGELAKMPGLVALELRQTPQGCDWLVGRWRTLAEAVGNAVDGTPRPLDDDNRRLACDLLGLGLEQRQGRTPLDPPDGVVSDDDAAHQAALIAAQIAELERLKAEALVELDELDRAAAELGFGPGVDPTLRLIRRYETDASRRMRQAKEELRRVQGEALEREPAPSRVVAKDRMPDISLDAESAFRAAYSGKARSLSSATPPTGFAEIAPSAPDDHGPAPRDLAPATPEVPAAVEGHVGEGIKAQDASAGDDSETGDRLSEILGVTRNLLASRPSMAPATFALPPAPPRNRHERRALERKSAHRT
jgi:hypothetical protein